MQKLTLTKQLFWLITAFIVAATLLFVFYLYHQNQQMTETRALGRAHSLQAYLKSMRYVYHQQFLASGLELNDSTVGFLPAHASALISDEFSKNSTDGTTIRNVSDRPRNPSNRADEHEREAIRFFQNNHDAKERLSIILHNNQEYFFYTAPILMEPYCLKCHGNAAEVLPYIAHRYDTAYDYNVGDIRGIISIKIPKRPINEQSMAVFWQETAFGFGVIFFLLGLIYYAIRELTRKENESKAMLQFEVKRQTAELEEKAAELLESNIRKQHLYSILRTIADSSQIIITAQSLEDLIGKTAHCLASNEALAGVKISLLVRGTLQIKAFEGIGEATLSSIDHTVLETNTAILIDDIHNGASPQLPGILVSHGITSIYATPLAKDSLATNAFGVMTIYTTQPEGFPPEEIELIEELSGDLGFAINSFFQKENIIKLSYYDPLTELPNRHLLMDRFKQAVRASSRSHHYGALLFVNLDNFKGINDLRGHIRGDDVLREFGRRLLSIPRQSDTVARFGGDEFILLLESIGTDPHIAANAALVVAQKVLNVSRDPFMFGTDAFYLTASIGIVLFDGEQNTVHELLSYADGAMHTAKTGGRNTIRFYDAALQEAMTAQAKMQQDLRIAIENRALYLVYQEQVDAHGSVVGVEALLRWEHPEHGMIPPSLFIPVAEESGMIVVLGEWILDQAIEQLRKWKSDPVRNGWRISANVSPKQFEQADFIPMLRRLLSASSINPPQLRLELTEGLLIRDAQQAMDKINELKEIGLTLSIDDFGTGYSSLSYLKHLPINELKIDQSFVRFLPHSSSDQTIVQTMITIADAFGFEVIAEGVETREQFDILTQMGCKLFQGYLFSRPQKLDE